MLCRLAAHHSCAIIEAGERGLADILSSEFDPAPDGLSSVLTYCDMTTSPDGELVPVGQRLAEIHDRYGPGHLVSRSIPKLRLILWSIPCLTWCFAGSAGWHSGYFKVSGIGAPMSWKACRWALVGSVSISMVTWVPVYRTWLRVRVARCSSRPRKLR